MKEIRKYLEISSFTSPALILFLIFIAYPIIFIIYSSFLNWDGVNPSSYIGFDNYKKIFTSDRAFFISIKNSLFWAFLTIFPQMLIGIFLAYILTRGVFLQNIFRAIFYLPAIVSPVVIGIIWQRIYNPFGGFLSDLAISSGMNFLMLPYLTDTKIAIFSVIIVNIWQWTGFSMLLYIAGIQSISVDIFDSVKEIGANSFQTIRYIIFPLLKHIHKTLILLGIIGTLQTFPLIFVLTKGGPNHATEMLPNYIFLQAFKLQSMGYASALSVILLVICLVLTLLQIKFLGSKFTIIDN